MTQKIERLNYRHETRVWEKVEESSQLQKELDDLLNIREDAIYTGNVKLWMLYVCREERDVL